MSYLGNLPLSDGAAALELLFAQKSDIDHKHSISDVDGLADALAGDGGTIPYATTTVAGKIKIATSSDTTSNDKAVTPASMSNFVNNAINNIGDINGVYGSGLYTIFKNPGVTTFNTPAGVTEARVTVIGPGGNGIDPTTGALAAGGGGGGFAQGIYPVSGSYNVTVGVPGSSSSFGTLLSATSGENGANVGDNLVGGNGGIGIGGNLVNRRGGRGSGGPAAPAEYINFTELPTGNGTIPSGVTTVTMIGKGGASVSILGNGSGKPWVLQYGFNDGQSTDITGWTVGSPLPASIYDSHAVVTKNRVYLLGGINDGGPTSNVYTAPIDSDGVIGTWTGVGTSLPASIYRSQAVVTKNRVYLLGGVNDGGPTSNVYTAPIDSDGVIGTWTAGSPLPASLFFSQAVVTKNRVYLLGGYRTDGGDLTSGVYTAPIDSDGIIGTWTAGSPLPASIYDSQAVVTKNRVYLLGGYRINGGGTTWDVYTAPIDSDGVIGTWTVGSPLPARISDSQAVVTKNRVYLLGGVNDGGPTSNVYTAPIDSDGVIGTWTGVGSLLPDRISDSHAVVTKNRVYLLGGINDGGPTSNVYTAPFAGGLNDYTYTSLAQNNSGVLNLINVSGNGSIPSNVTSVVLSGKGEDALQEGTDGAASTITFNGTTYTFPGGSSTLPAVTTVFNITLPGTSAVAYSYTKPAVGTELSINYSSSSIGAATTISVNGVDYTFPGGVNGPATQSIQNAYLTGNTAVNYSYNIAPGGLGAISYQVPGGGGAGVVDSGGTGGGASGCYSEAFMRDAYGNHGGGFGNGMDTSVVTSGVTSIAHNFSGGGGNNSIGGGKGGIGGGGGGGATGGIGLVIVEW